MRATSEAGVGVMDAASVRRVGKGRLLQGFAALVRKDLGNTANMLVYIGEIDRRKLHRLERLGGCPTPLNGPRER